MSCSNETLNQDRNVRDIDGAAKTERHAGGRPQWVPPDLEKVEAIAREAVAYCRISAALGISRHTLQRRMMSSDTFKAAIMRGRKQGIAQGIEALCYNAVIKNNVQAQNFIMKNVHNWEIRAAVELTGPEGGLTEARESLDKVTDLCKLLDKYKDSE